VQQKEEKEKRKQEKHLARLEKDLLEAKGGKVVLDASRAPQPDDDGTLREPFETSLMVTRSRGYS
jgi:hypothetical protein